MAILSQQFEPPKLTVQKDDNINRSDSQDSIRDQQTGTDIS